MNDIHILARCVIGGFGGVGTVRDGEATGPNAGTVFVDGTDAFGNEGHGHFSVTEWRKAIQAECDALQAD